MQSFKIRKNKSVLNLLVAISINLLLILSAHKISCQTIDTAELYKIINSNAKSEQKIAAFTDLCSELLEQKSYDRLEDISKEFLKYSNKTEDKKGTIDALYYLVRASYFLKLWDQCAYYGKIGLGLSQAIKYKEKEAYFNNILGITERRMDNCEEAIQYYLDAIAINKEILDSVTLASNYNNLSRCYRTTGQIAKSLEVLKEGLKIQKEIPDTNGIANVYMSIGNTYNDVNNYEEAIENYLEANTNYELIGNKSMIAGSLLNIGLVYHKLNNFDQAINYYIQVKDFAQDGGLEDILGIVYQNLGNIYSSQNKPLEAIVSQKKALELFTKLDQLGNQNDALLNIGIEFSKLANIDSALYYFNESLEISNITKDNHDISNVHLEIGRLHTRNNRFERAEEYLLKGLNLAITGNDLEMQSFGNLYLFELFDKKGLSKKALDHYKIYISQKDSLDLLEQEKLVTKIKAQYDFDKQENEIELLNKENLLKEAEVNKISNQRKLLLALLALFGLGIGGITFLFQFSKRKNRIITQEKNKAEKLLLNILPFKIAKELTDAGKVKAQKHFYTTVLFTDFVQFSNFSENVEPEEVVRNIDFYFKKFDEIIKKYNLEKIKTIGDAYMCVGGLPVPDADHAINAVNAAKEMLQFVIEVKTNPPVGIHPFDIRIGLNSGPVVAGVVGITKFQYDIWGDTVNMAAKMEAGAGNGNIGISESTYLKVKDHMRTKYLGIVPTKNQGSAKMYTIVM